jgi:tRNA A37 threonylcarbamoyladenosine dehydratase
MIPTDVTPSLNLLNISSTTTNDNNSQIGSLNTIDQLLIQLCRKIVLQTNPTSNSKEVEKFITTSYENISKLMSSSTFYTPNYDMMEVSTRIKKQLTNQNRQDDLNAFHDLEGRLENMVN